MSGRPIYRVNEGAEVTKIENRVDALERRRDVAGFYQIKVFADDEIIVAGDGAFIFSIPFDLDQARLRHVDAYVTTVSSSGSITIDIRNVTEGFDLLTTFGRIVIPAGALNPTTSPGEIDTDVADEYAYPYSNNTVFNNQQIAIDIDGAGSGAKGLGVMLGFD